MRKIESIIVHCSATGLDTKPNDIKRYHMEQLGWKDCGYHFIITPDGEEYEMRPLEMVGAHCYNQNQNSIGICLIGGKYKFDFSLDQLLALVALLKRLSHIYRIDKSYIFNHSDFNKSKLCPRFDVQKLIKYEKGFY